MKNQLPTYYIGHITRDIPPGADPETAVGLLGGPVTYGIVADVRTRHSASKPTLITKVGMQEPLLHKLVNLASQEMFETHTIEDPQKDRGITTYANRYDPKGRRTQYRYTQASPFGIADIQSIKAITGTEGANFVLGTVTGWGEMTQEFIQQINRLKGDGKTMLIAQGLHRYVDDQNRVFHRPIPEESMDGIFEAVDYCVMSDEDVALGEKNSDGTPLVDELYMRSIADRVGTYILTQGPEGALMFNQGKFEGNFAAFPLTDRELSVMNPTGLGDTFAAIFGREMMSGRDVGTSIALAHLVTAAKLAEGSNTIQGRGEGMGSLLTASQLARFVQNDVPEFDNTFRESVTRRQRVMNYSNYMEFEHGAQLQGVLESTYGISLETGRNGVEYVQYASRR